MKLPDLGKMVGPLPVGGWVAVVAAGGGIALLGRKATAAKATDTDAAATEVPAAMIYPATPTTSGPTGLSPSAPSLPPQTTITDNGQWVAEAIKALVQQGYAPYTVQQCLQRFLEGVIQGEPCAGIVNAAILAIGPPPTGAPVNQFPMAPPAPSPRPASQPVPPVPAAAKPWRKGVRLYYKVPGESKATPAGWAAAKAWGISQGMRNVTVPYRSTALGYYVEGERQ